MAKQVNKAGGISSDAVKAKTGKSWAQWFAILDRAGANHWPHREIAEHLFKKCGCSGWWSQMITVGYEQERGRRVKNQNWNGEFSTNGSKTIGVPIAVLYKSWTDEKMRAKWLPDSAKITVRKANVNKSLRISWHDGTSVEVNFWDKGPCKSQAAVQHRKLESTKEVARLKAHWAKALATLQQMLEQGPKKVSPNPVKRTESRKTATKKSK